MASQADYQRGYEKGKTEASIEGLAHALDEVRERLEAAEQRDSRRPCVVHSTQIKIQWAAIVGILMGMAALFFGMIQDWFTKK